MSLKALKILASLAEDLDKKGNTKIADHVEDMMNKISQSLPSAPAPAKLGDLRPAGDPYTYNLNSDLTFSIATTPREEKGRVGNVIRPGEGGYEILKAEAIRVGLMSEPDPQGATSPRAWELIRELNLQSVPSPDEAEAQADSSEALFRGDMAGLVERIKNYAYSGLFGGGSSAAVVESAARPLSEEGLTGEGASEAWRNVRAVAQGILDSEEVSNLGRAFDKALEKWTRGQNLRRLSAALRGGNMADDGLDEAEEEPCMVSDASLTPSDRINKVASLTEEYKKVFWFEPNRPFNRIR